MSVRTHTSLHTAAAVLAVAVAMSAMSALAPPLAAAPAQDGAMLFRDRCMLCHGADGSGNTSMGKAVKAGDLRSAPIQSQTDAQLAATVSKGKGSMPAFETLLSKQEIAAVVRYLRTFKAKR